MRTANAANGNRQQFSFPMGNIACSPTVSPSGWPSGTGHNPDVVGWQLDNQYGDALGPSAKAQFHAWLKRNTEPVPAKQALDDDVLE